MRNSFPLWKNLLIVVVLTMAIVYSLPNFFGEDPSVQLSPIRNTKVDQSVATEVENALKAGGIAYKSVELLDKRLLVRLSDTDTQLKVSDVLSGQMGSRFVVALNLAPATPAWLNTLGAKPMYLGLDLRGGVHFLLQVDMEAAIAQAHERFVEDARTLLRENKLRYQTVEKKGDAVVIHFQDNQTLGQAAEVIKREIRGMAFKETDPQTLEGRLTEVDIREIKKFAVAQNTTTLRNRVNELGVAEPVIQQQGDDRIVVQLPGVQDTARAKEILGATATLEFRLVDGEHAVQSENDKVPLGSRMYKDRAGRPLLLERKIIVTGDQVVDAASGIDQQGGAPAVYVTLNGAGAKKMADVTRENIGRSMAVVFIENKTDSREVNGQRVSTHRKVEEVINVATIRDHFSKRFQITGLDSTEEARNLSLLLRAGALAAPVDIVEERTVGPSLGKENIEQGVRSFMIGFALVAAVVLFYYKVFGVVAIVTLVFNVALVLAILSGLQATLTLPGIAGITLTVGMAVDANVLIYERIKEEMRNGSSAQAAIYAGFDRAFGTIFDSHITNLMAAIMLFGVGSGPVKGFAVSLSIGIITSLFTAVTCSRMMVNWIYGQKRAVRLWI